MKININSWHYKYLRKNKKFPKENLCSYAWCLFILMFEHLTWIGVLSFTCWVMGLAAWIPSGGGEYLTGKPVWLTVPLLILVGAVTIALGCAIIIGVILLCWWIYDKVEKLTFPKFFSKLKIKCIKVEYTDK